MWKRTRGVLKEQSERIRALEEALEGVRTPMKAMRLEWEDTFNRLEKTMGRLNASARKLKQREATQEAETAEIEGAAPGAPPRGVHATLTDMRRRTHVLPR